MIYRLSDAGRALLWTQWQKIGGCGIPNDSEAPKHLPQSRWDTVGMRLGDIEDACPYTGRTLARFAVSHLQRPELADEYRPQT